MYNKQDGLRINFLKIYCGLFFLILVVFFFFFLCVVSSFTTFRPNFTSGLFLARGEIWPKRSERRNNTQKNYQDEEKKSAINKKINSQIKKTHLKMIPIKDKNKMV